MKSSGNVRFGFERDIVQLPLASILPIRQVKASDGSFGKYKAIIASIRSIGLVEPLVVFPNNGTKGAYLLLDGHLRLKALQDLNQSTAECLISVDDDAFTYNDKINGLSLIQENRMIKRALEEGVSEKKIADALDIDVKKIINGKSLLEGVHPEALQILRDKPITERALRSFKQVKALRQIEMAQLMVSGNNYTFAYARALLVGTRRELLEKPDDPSRVRGLSSEEVARMEREMENLERDFRVFQDQYGQNMLHLGVAQRYVRKLLSNQKIKKFLHQRHPEIGEELSELAALDTL